MTTNRGDAERLMRELSRTEKVAMMSGGLEFWKGVTALGQHDYYHKHPFPAGVCERLGIAGIHFIDGPRGIVLEGGATTYPVSMARGASFNPALEQQIGDAIGKELRAMGGNLYGGVCINLLRHPAWGRAQETYGEDPVHLGAMGAALTRGVEQHGMACIKHYALNSMENARFQIDVSIAPRPLHELYLPHFKECIDHGASVVMSAYNSVNGEWAGQDKVLLTDILRTRWGFEGFVLTDFIMGVRDGHKAIEAGLDLEMPFPIVWGDKLARLLDTGAVDEALLDQALVRMISPQLILPPAQDYGAELIGADAHKALAREAAVQSIVLLKNDKAALPLAGDASIAVLGDLAAKPNLGDHGSSDGRPETVVTPLDGLCARWDQVVHTDITDSATIKGADAVVVVVGYTFREEGEFIVPQGLGEFIKRAPAPPFKNPILNGVSKLVWRLVPAGLIDRAVAAFVPDDDNNADFGRGGDRTSLRLPQAHVDLIGQACALHDRVIVAVMGGSAVMMDEWDGNPAAILMLWYPGMEGGHGLADLLSGDRNFSAKLPFAVPADEAHLPFFDKDATQITYDLWHGYRKLDRDGNKAAYPFGFGLSYTRFTYANLTAAQSGETLSFALEVTNAGPVAGDEIVQLYMSAPGEAVERAEKELKAFTRVSLAPGETKTVTLTVPVAKLAYFDEAADDFVIENGRYQFTAAAHADDAEALAVEVTL